MAGRGVVLAVLAASFALPIALAPAAQAPARGALPVKVKVATAEDGPYRPYLRRDIPLNETKSLWIQIKSTSPNPQQLALNDNETSSGRDGWNVRWFKGKDNISSEVQSEGSTFRLAAGKSKRFEVKIRHTAEDGEPFCLDGKVFDISMDSYTVTAGINGECSI